MSDFRTFSPTNSNTQLENLSIKNSKHSVIVVGAGVMGAWTALHCLRRGCKVTLFDKWGPGNSTSSSGGETRLIRAIYGNGLVYTQLTYESIARWKDLEKQVGKTLFNQTGIHWLLSEEHPELFEPSVALLGDSHPIRLVNRDQFAKRYPFTFLGDIAQILHEDNAGYILAREAVNQVVQQFMNEGGEYETEKLSPSESSSGIKLLRENGQEVTSDLKFLATGPWLKTLLPDLFSTLVVSRQEVHYYSFSRMATKFTPWVDYNPENMFYGIWDHANRGIKVAHDLRGVEIDPDTEVRLPDSSELEASQSYLQHRFPGLGKVSLSESRVCQYSNTTDGNIIIDKHPGDDSLIIVGGGSGHSFKLGPAIGRLAYEIGSGQRPVEDFCRL